MEPVLHWLAAVTVAPGAVTVTVLVAGGEPPRFIMLAGLGVAAARRASAKNAYRKAAGMRANILDILRLLKTTEDWLLQTRLDLGKQCLQTLLLYAAGDGE